MNSNIASGKIYTCPMHPEIKKDVSGICPKCGMTLVPKEKKPNQDEDKTSAQMGHVKADKKPHDKHKGHTQEEFFQKFWVSLVLTIPVILYSELPERFFQWRAPSFFGDLGAGILITLFSSIIFFYGGLVFIKGAIGELKARQAGMMSLISLAITTAYIYSLFTIFTGGNNLFWELSTLITIMLLGHWMEMRAVTGTQRALSELSKLLPDVAEIVIGNKTKTIKIEELRVGDIVLTRPGGRIAADGKVQEGESEVDESAITGESKPQGKKKGSEVVAGTINGDGILKIKVTKIGKDTFLAGVMRLVEEAQASKSKIQLLSDRAAYYLTLIAIFAGLLTLILWLIARAQPSFAIERAVAVLVIACPHALGLAIPLVATISTTLAAKSGFLIRQRLALEAARNINVVMFDKTGTLTQGKYGVENIWSTGVVDKDEVLKLAASVDVHSEHFIAKAVTREAKKRKIDLQYVKKFSRIPGQGVKGQIAGDWIYVGGETLLDSFDIKLPQEYSRKLSQAQKNGQTIIYVIYDKDLIGIISLADIIREESKKAIKKLKALDIEVAMITGDSEDVAGWVARELKIDKFFAKVLPEDKAEKVKLLQKQGRQVAMVGDGINDAPALTQSDVGIAIGAGTNVALESAGIILVRNDPRDIPKIIELSRATYSKMIQNLFWATGYNVVALPLAAGVLASRGLLLQPALAALFMSLSTVIVAINALTLRWRRF